MRRPDATLLLHICALILCGLALLRPQLRLPLAPPKVAFLVDTSSSFEWARRPLARLLAQKAASLPPDSRITLYTFGDGIRRNETTTASRFRVKLGPFKEGASRTGPCDLSAYSRVWLFTDGHADITIRCRRLDAVLLHPPFDCSVSDVDISPPERGALMRVRATVLASHPTSCRVSLKVGAEEKTLSLRTGPRGRVVSFTMKTPDEPVDVRVRVEADGDGNPTNDAVTFTLVPAGKKVVGYVGPGGATVEALRKAGFSVRLLERGDVGRQLGLCDALVLEDVAWEDLTVWDWARLAEVCRSGGLGLVVLGARRAFGMGGYGGRLIEEVLPLNCRPRESQPTALVVLMDSSGSMGERVGGMTKWRLALGALGAMLGRLGRGDALGVVIFDTEAHTIRPLAAWSEDEKGVLLERLGVVRPTGGTNLWRGLAAATRPLLKKIKAKKAILLLSDGHTTGKPTPQNFAPKVFRRHKVSIHAVALGSAPNIDLLALLARKTGGTLQRARFFSDELERALKGALGNLKGFFRKGDFGVEGRGPTRVSFYTRTAPKEGAEVLAHVEGAPLIARWRYGAGGVVAVTTSSDGGLADWDGFSSFLAEAVNWSTPAHTWARAFFEGDVLCVRVGGLPQGITGGRMWMGGVWREAVAVDFGVLEARFEGVEVRGPVVVEAGGRRWRATLISVGPEREVGVDVERLRGLVRRYGGKVYEAEEFITEAEEHGLDRVELWRYFVLAALALVLVALLLPLVRRRRL